VYNLYQPGVTPQTEKKGEHPGQFGQPVGGCFLTLANKKGEHRPPRKEERYSNMGPFRKRGCRKKRIETQVQ